VPTLIRTSVTAMSLSTIISGGQTGADRMGLDWAHLPRRAARRMVPPTDMETLRTSSVSVCFPENSPLHAAKAHIESPSPAGGTEGEVPETVPSGPLQPFRGPKQNNAHGCRRRDLGKMGPRDKRDQPRRRVRRMAGHAGASGEAGGHPYDNDKLPRWS